MTRRPDYVRIYSDADGETHFQDVVLGLTEPASSGETARIAVGEPLDVHRLIFRRVLEEASATVPHNAPCRQVIVILAGEIEVEVSDGEVRREWGWYSTAVARTHPLVVRTPRPGEGSESSWSTHHRFSS